MNEELIKKFQDLKAKQSELLSEKLKYEAKKEQLVAEIKSIQDKYPKYDLSTSEAVENIIKTLTNQLNNELISINERYEKLKAVKNV